MLSTVSWVAPTVEPLGKTTLDVILAGASDPPHEATAAAMRTDAPNITSRRDPAIKRRNPTPLASITTPIALGNTPPVHKGANEAVLISVFRKKIGSSGLSVGEIGVSIKRRGLFS
jgi:hypothetical protein